MTPSITPPWSEKWHGNVQIEIRRRKASVVDERHASRRVREIGFEPGKKRERGVRGAGRIPFCPTAFAEWSWPTMCMLQWFRSLA